VSHHGAGTDHCTAAYRDARENNGTGADGCSLFKVRPEKTVGVSWSIRIGPEDGRSSRPASLPSYRDVSGRIVAQVAWPGSSVSLLRLLVAFV
jgi:hypothetical protein